MGEILRTVWHLLRGVHHRKGKVSRESQTGLVWRDLLKVNEYIPCNGQGYFQPPKAFSCVLFHVFHNCFPREGWHFTQHRFKRSTVLDLLQKKHLKSPKSREKMEMWKRISPSVCVGGLFCFKTCEHVNITLPSVIPLVLRCDLRGIVQVFCWGSDCQYLLWGRARSRALSKWEQGFHRMQLAQLAQLGSTAWPSHCWALGTGVKPHSAPFHTALGRFPGFPAHCKYFKILQLISTE